MKGFILAACLAAACSAQANISTNRARSVHLRYAPIAERAVAFRGSVAVAETQTNSYFAVINCERAYCGIQDLGGRRVFIFSVWEPGDPADFAANESAVAADARAKILFSAPGTEVSRFGGEGTGAKTLTDIGWKTGERVSAQIEIAPDGERRTAFTCLVRTGDGEWRRIATISTVGTIKSLGGLLASFVEDFWRRPPSASLVRRAVFSDFASRSEGSAEWVPATKAKFTADSLPAANIDAGKVGPGAFFLQTGGDTKNEHTPLWGTIE